MFEFRENIMSNIGEYLGSDCFRPAETTAKTLTTLNNGTSSGDGVYRIDPDGPSTHEEWVLRRHLHPMS